ncbi:COP9 signalosome complex subunit 6 [Histomonas meleagridis]|uniref:COP9 signalosome complex subunit 6 n=1 Tax=Histomonas meleagridis TaxID=135588 RepID=UPI00355AC844|nr:COP9 signalosome complex subunit 6 [Histomonas meleagridis]KAH0806345.1 COP9 signalosome complex subunit 6 [Histomonas meleagridis]
MQSNISVSLHPHVMFVISDHANRIPFMDPPIKYACGILLGSYDSNKVEVNSAFEIKINEREDGKLELDKEVYNTMYKVRNKVFPFETPIGWFVSQDYPQEEIDKLQSIISDADNMECMLRINFNKQKDQMISVFLIEGDKSMPVDYSYESELGERIAMMQLQAEGDAESQIEFTADAFKALDAHLAEIQTYLIKVLNKEAPFDPVIIRECSTISQWFSHKDPNEHTEAIATEEQSNLALLCGMMLEVLSKAEHGAKRN